MFFRIRRRPSARQDMTPQHRSQHETCQCPQAQANKISGEIQKFCVSPNQRLHHLDGGPKYCRQRQDPNQRPWVKNGARQSQRAKCNYVLGFVRKQSSCLRAGWRQCKPRDSCGKTHRRQDCRAVPNGPGQPWRRRCFECRDHDFGLPVQMRMPGPSSGVPMNSMPALSKHA